MANNKVGFDFYRTDTDRYQDIKIKRLKKKYKCNGIAVYDYILNEIYRVRGYYLEWDTNMSFDIADYWDIDEALVIEIVNYCCQINLFHKPFITSENIITSKSIQVRFLKMSKISKRNDTKIQEEYLLIQEESVKLPEECDQNSGSLPHRREEKSIVKNSRGEGKEKEKVFSPPLFVDVELFFKDKIPDTFWDFSKCSAEAKAFIDYYAKTGWITKHGPITNWENAANGWITNDEKFKKEKIVSSTGKAFPNKFDRSYMTGLSADDQKKYRNHLNSIGLYFLGKDGLGNSIWGAKEQTT